MPLFKKYNFDSSTTVYVWKITESFQKLSEEIALKESCKQRVEGMKSELHQRGFLSVRKLLGEAGYNDFDLYYDEFGKPHLHDGKYISITHSHQFSSIIISDKKVGIDIELQREKIIRIADKFCNAEFEFLEKDHSTDYIKKLTVIWGIKESIFKIRNEKGISFKDHINVAEFRLEEFTALANLNFNGINEEFKVFFEDVEDFSLVYAMEK